MNEWRLIVLPGNYLRWRPDRLHPIEYGPEIRFPETDICFTPRKSCPWFFIDLAFTTILSMGDEIELLRGHFFTSDIIFAPCQEPLNVAKGFVC